MTNSDLRSSGATRGHHPDLGPGSNKEEEEERYVPFDPNRIPDGIHCSLYMPSSFPLRI